MNSALTDYIETCRETAIYPEKGEMSDRAVTYCVVGLLGEAGEIANKWKKVLRGDSSNTSASIREDNAALLAECGDVAWYLTRLCEELGSDLASVMGENANRLLSRKERGTLRGEGDSR